MTIDEIKTLNVKGITSSDCALFLWVTSPLLPEGLEVIKAWGFKFKTIAFCWNKITNSGKDVANLGQWTLGNIELCLLGTKGSPKRLDRTVRQLVTAERGKHSEKPHEVRNRIQQIFGPDSRYVELFARRRTPGWEAWGNEI
jgi:N6-adenosine-specific RNA methylase IME4